MKRRWSDGIHRQQHLFRTHFHITRPPIEIEVKVFDLAILGELFRHVLLRRLLVDIGNQNDPSFNR